ncbi:hypothetical protein [Maribacter halichondriae]|uniref:hypothetical protein n=1 Tax=Maribacter halichondriae TaxID=2980554 RepID=UPI002358D3F3|nr:hypothetical protein [Maribacter sp. Hal144]
MKKIIPAFALCAVVLLTLSATVNMESESNLTADFVYGNPKIASINHMSFGPEGILFLGDSQNAAIYALETKDLESTGDVTEINMGEFDKKIASSLGTTIENIKISDMAVNPISKNIYFSVQVADGTPILLKLKGRGLKMFP